jgi:hypothetical protein
MNYGYKKINKALRLLDGRLTINQSNGFSLVVCGGTALNAMHLIQRTTKDVDIVALMDSNNTSRPRPPAGRITGCRKRSR